MRHYVKQIAAALVAISIVGITWFCSGIIRDTPAISYIISDARQLVVECIVYEDNLGVGREGAIIRLEDALSSADEGFREDIRKQIESGTILFFPPTIPVRENRIVCIVIWEDLLITIDGTPWAEAYKKK